MQRILYTISIHVKNKDITEGLKNRKRLFAGTLPANKNLFAGTVPENKNLFAGTPQEGSINTFYPRNGFFGKKKYPLVILVFQLRGYKIVFQAPY